MESDAQLVRRVLAGDRDAYAELVERYEHAVFAVASKIVADRDAAEETAQTAFVNAYTQLDCLHDPSAFGAWLLMITRREAMRVSRSRLQTVPLDDHDAATSSTDSMLEQERQHELMTALSQLSDPDQQVLMLRYFQSQPVAAIAVMTGRSVGTVTKQISRAISRLRTQLKGRGS